MHTRNLPHHPDVSPKTSSIRPRNANPSWNNCLQTVKSVTVYDPEIAGFCISIDYELVTDYREASKERKKGDNNGLRTVPRFEGNSN